MGELIFSLAYGGGMIIVGLFAKYMVSQMAKKEIVDKNKDKKEVS